MRTVLVFVLTLALGLLCFAACTATTSPDEVCLTNGGVCFTTSDMVGCDMPLSFPCSNGYVCCTSAYRASIGEAGVVTDAPSGNPGPLDAGADAATAAAPGRRTPRRPRARRPTAGRTAARKARKTPRRTPQPAAGYRPCFTSDSSSSVSVMPSRTARTCPVREMMTRVGIAVTP